MKQSKGQNPGKGAKRQIGGGDEGEFEEDLDEIQVDINKNFTMLTSFGSFSILYLIERYIFDTLYQALAHYFNLNLPIKNDQHEFYKKLLSLILRATNFVMKETHKDKSRELFKMIKNLGCYDLQLYYGYIVCSVYKNQETRVPHCIKYAIDVFVQVYQWPGCVRLLYLRCTTLHIPDITISCSYKG